jgi:hypothetical protein
MPAEMIKSPPFSMPGLGIAGARMPRSNAHESTKSNSFCLGEARKNCQTWRGWAYRAQATPRLKTHELNRCPILPFTKLFYLLAATAGHRSKCRP